MISTAPKFESGDKLPTSKRAPPSGLKQQQHLSINQVAAESGQSKSNVRFQQPLPSQTNKDTSPLTAQDRLNSVSQITKQQSSQFSLLNKTNGNGNRKLLSNNFTNDQAEHDVSLMQDSAAQLELALLQEYERAEQYVKNRKEHIDTRRLSAKPLLFGTEPLLSYKGHNGQPILSIIENHNNRLNVSFDQKTIHCWSTKPGHPKAQVVKMIDIVKTHSSVITMAYSKKYRLYLIVTSDFKFIFMNELNIVVQPHIEMSIIRLVNHAHFHDEKDLLITGGNHGVFIFHFDYKGKYSPHLAAQVDPKGAYIKIQLLNKQPVSDMLEWCKGLRVDTRSNIIISWDWEIVSINTLAHHGRLVSQFRELCEKDEKILDVLVFSDYRYFVTATTAGNIYVFKYVTQGKIETQRRLIHTFTGHFKAIPSICQFEKQPHLLLSASYDCTARIWSLDTFQHQYTFELPSGLNFIKIFQGARYITFGRSEVVQTHELHMVLENYTPTESTITQLQTAHMSIWDKLNCRPAFTISLCDDNSAFMKQVLQKVKDQKTTLYPPPSSQVMQSISFSMRIDRLIVLLTNSTICIYKRLKETALLEQILEPREILDSEGKRAINQDITYMGIFQTRAKRDIRCMDTDVINHRLHVLSLITALACPQKNQEFLAIGLSKGAVILLHTRQLQFVYVRLTLHREAITMIRYLPNVRMFVTFCAENYLKIWRCHKLNKKAQICYDFKFPKKTQDVLVLFSPEESNIERFLVIFASGESELFEFDSSDDSLFWIESEKAREHDSQLNGFDYNPKLKLIVTGDNTGVIRIWNSDKKFLREIVFPTPIDSVCFLNERGDLLVSHAKRVSYIKFTTYWSKVFDYYGITVAKDDEELAQKAKDDESLFCDADFVIEQWYKRIKIDSEDKIRMIFQGKPQSQKSLLTQPSDISNLTHSLAIEKRTSSVSKVISTNQIPRALKVNKTQQSPMKKGTAPTVVSTIRPQPTMNEKMVQSTLMAGQSSMTAASGQLPDDQLKNKNSSWSFIEDVEVTTKERRKFLNGKLKALSPYNVTALPRSQGLPKVGLIQPLPGMSYLATSTTYYEMQAHRQRSNKSVPLKSNRRIITENRITTNIMSYNTPHALNDTQNMEVSSDYQTSVSQSKYQLSGYRLGSLFSQQPLPLDYLLNTDLAQLSNQLMSQRMQRQQNETQTNLFGSFQTNGGAQIEQQKQSRNRKIRSQHRTRSGVNEMECQTPWSGSALQPSSTTAADHQPLNASTMNMAEHRRRTVIPPSVRAQFSIEFQSESMKQGDGQVETITNRKNTTAQPKLKQALKDVGTLKNNNLTNDTMPLPPQSQLLPSKTADFELSRDLVQSKNLTTNQSVGIVKPIQTAILLSSEINEKDQDLLAEGPTPGMTRGKIDDQEETIVKVIDTANLVQKMPITELDLKGEEPPVASIDEVLIGGSAINTAADDYVEKPSQFVVSPIGDMGINLQEHPHPTRHISSSLHGSNQNLIRNALAHSNSVIQPNLSNTLIGSSKQNRSGNTLRNTSSHISHTMNQPKSASGHSRSKALDSRSQQNTMQRMSGHKSGDAASQQESLGLQVNGTSLTPQIPPMAVEVGMEVKEEGQAKSQEAQQVLQSEQVGRKEEEDSSLSQQHVGKEVKVPGAQDDEEREEVGDEDFIPQTVEKVEVIMRPVGADQQEQEEEAVALEGQGADQ